MRSRRVRPESSSVSASPRNWAWDKERTMKICIFGAGAIGGYMGAKLAQAGADVSLVARGPHLKAMREDGLRLIEESGETTVKVTASDDAADLGPQDYVIVT